MPSRRRKLRRTRARRRRKLTIAAFLLIAVAVVVGTVGFGTAASIGRDCNLGKLRPASIGSNSFIYAADGSLLGSIPAEKNRQPVTLAETSPWMAKATVAIEDRRFYKHGGVDPQGIARAVVNDIKAGHAAEGGSTITQQLVRNLYIRHNERTLRRKVVEACLAVKLSQDWSKDKILAEYMNTVYYGNHAYGVEAAARTYFSRPANKLSLLQAALLAGLPQAPSDYDPFDYPEPRSRGATRCSRRCTRTTRSASANYQEAVRVTKLHLRAGRIYTTIREPYFFSYVRDELVKKYGAETVRSGGLKVYTTIDRALPARREQGGPRHALLRHRPRVGNRRDRPRNGAIKTMTAVTPGRTGNQFNLAAQARRQAGSTFKMYVLAEAIAEGVNPDTTSYVSAPLHYQPDPYSQAWDVSTYSHTYVGLDLDHARVAALGQHRLCPAHARPRPREGRGDGDPPRRALVAEDEGGRLCPVARPRLDRRLAAGHGLRVRDDRRRRHLLRSRWRSGRSCSRTASPTRMRAGASRTGAA